MIIMLYLLVILCFIINNCVTSDEFDDVTMDPVIYMLLNSEEWQEYSENKNESSDQFVFLDGLWKCGNCSEANELIYNETYEIHYSDYEYNHEVQIGISVDNVRCIAVKAKQEALVSIVGGSCSGEMTLKLDNTDICELFVYG